MTGQVRQSRFAMTVPDIGLQPGQAVGLEMAAFDQNTDPPDAFGGIMIIIVGG